MQKKLIIGGLITFVIGIIILWISPTWGISLADGKVSQWGGMDGEQYNALMKSYMNSIRLIGGIVATFGGLEALFAFYFYNSKEVSK